MAALILILNDGSHPLTSETSRIQREQREISYQKNDFQENHVYIVGIFFVFMLLCSIVEQNYFGPLNK